MAIFSIDVNNKKYDVDVDSETPLLGVLRDELGLTGTKYRGGIGICGSCIVLRDGVAIRSCRTKISEIGDSSIITIEGWYNDEQPLSKAWSKEDVPQCGYCQPGQILTAASMLEENPNPSEEEINKTMKRVLCRCSTYPRIKKAINRVVNEGGTK